ncbi:MAG TPA: DMT family transporter [Pseudonocardiaceae bacterium]|jgi:drug/metabolite transporter (DMT)-like permease
MAGPASGNSCECAWRRVGPDVVLSIVLAVAASMANAVASVLQRKAARERPESEAFEFRLLWHLVRQRAWLGGVTAMICGFVLQAAALGTGPIALVQPILILELGFTLVLSGFVFHTGLRAREWLAVAGMSVGVALLLFALRPTGGNPGAVSGWTWALASAVTVGVVGVLALVGYRARDTGRAAYLGVATGIGFGFTAALIAGITAGGLSHLFLDWQTYALVVAGPAGFFLLQNALQSGRLVASQPGLTLSNPLTALGWGVAVFGERAQTGGWIVLAVIGVAFITVCTVLLGRSLSLQDSG